MKVHYLCSYYSQKAHKTIAPRPKELEDAFKFCLAVKSGTVGGQLTIPWKKGPEVVHRQNASRAREAFGIFMQRVFKNNQYGDAAIVPVPSKDSYAVRENFRSHLMVQKSKPAQMSNPILPLVHYTAELQPASKGGPRGYGAIYPHLKVSTVKVPTRRVVLVDDIVTSGSNLLATRDRLKEAGFDILAAVVCGRTEITTDKGFGVREFDLEHDFGEFDF